MNKTIHTLSLQIILAVALLTSAPSSTLAQEDSAPDEFEVPQAPDETPFNQNTDAMQKQSNKMWIAYNRWVHKVMICLNDEDPSDYSIKRLLKHEDSVDDLIDSYYSDNLGKKLSELLFVHKALAAEMRKALRAGDNDMQAEAYRKMMENKNEVIEFLRQASPLYTVAQAEGR